MRTGSIFRRAWGVMLLVAMMLLIPATRQRIGAALFSPAEKHIAVLPFSVIGSRETNDIPVDGFMESLTSKLSNLEVGNRALWVVPASEVRRRKVADTAGAQKAFGVTLVITGTFQRTPRLAAKHARNRLLAA